MSVLGNRTLRKFTRLLVEYVSNEISDITSKLSKVAFSGNYIDLTNRPTIPSVGNGTVTIRQGGVDKGTFTLNQSGNVTIELTDLDTWRGIQNNLTSSSATDSLSANQGKVLNERITSEVAKLNTSLAGKAATNHTHNEVAGHTFDLATANSTDTWLLVKKDNTIQHRDIGTLPFLPSTGGVVNGPVLAGDSVGMWTDDEGGNVQIISPDGTLWEIDAHDNQLRIFRYEDDLETPVTGMTINKDGEVRFDNGFNTTDIMLASTSTAGLMSSAMVTKLNGIATGATANSPSSTTPKANGTAAKGSESAYARGDHVHPLQTSVSGSSGSCTGNAATATRLASAFTLTIGSSGKSIAGNSNVSYSLSEIGAAAASHNHDSSYYTKSQIDSKVGGNTLRCVNYLSYGFAMYGYAYSINVGNGSYLIRVQGKIVKAPDSPSSTDFKHGLNLTAILSYSGLPSGLLFMDGTYLTYKSTGELISDAIGY